MDIEGTSILDREGFHSTFSNAFGFPEYYGRNMDAWIDCMTTLDDPEPQSDLSVKEGDFVVLKVESAEIVQSKSPEIWKDINECVAFVNFRRMEAGHQPILALAYSI